MATISLLLYTCVTLNLLNALKKKFDLKDFSRFKLLVKFMHYFLGLRVVILSRNPTC